MCHLGKVISDSHSQKVCIDYIISFLHDLLCTWPYVISHCMEIQFTPKIDTILYVCAKQINAKRAQTKIGFTHRFCKHYIFLSS